MNLDRVTSGRDLANDINVIVEIPMNANPIKYEVDKATGALFVDRFVSTAMHYPCNYGYIPDTLSDDGDPVDVLVITPFPLLPGVVVRCRPIGILNMTDEAGGDTKLLAVPIDKLTPIYRSIETVAPEAQPLPFYSSDTDQDLAEWLRSLGETPSVLGDGTSRIDPAESFGGVTNLGGTGTEE